MNETGICLEAKLPLSWRREDAIPASQLEQRRLANISLLKALAALEASSKENDDVPEAVRRSLDRVESKLDILLLLVSRIAMDNAPLPEEHFVRLTQTSIQWEGASTALPLSGDKVCIHVYPSPRLPQPLVLQAVVRQVESGQCEAELAALDEETDEWLTRTIFRYHRRAVHARKQP